MALSARNIALSEEHNPGQEIVARAHYLGKVKRHPRILKTAMTGCPGPLGKIRITGGGEKSHLWNQIKADITQRKILVPEVQDSELLGDACIGLFALGGCGDDDGVTPNEQPEITEEDAAGQGHDAQVGEVLTHRGRG